jgi:hypothetical protein
MCSQTLRKPILTRSDADKNDPVEAVAILAGFAAKFQGGNRNKQDMAAKIAVSLLHEGVPAVIALKIAIERVIQPP